MKKISRFIAAAVFALFVPVAIGMPASAAFVCEIGYTGPDSNNMCTSEVEYDCEVNNTNNVTIRSSEDQEAYSGDVTVNNNGSTGSSTSGTASNSSGTTFNVVINNGASDNDPDTCVANAVVPAGETPETPTPGRGEAPVQPSQNVTPTALPVTSGDTAPVIFLVGGLVAAGALAVAYRRLF